MRLALICLCAVASVLPAEAEDLYFTQNGAGAADGSSAANAWSLAQANTAGNWGVGAGKVSAGDTLHVSGTVTNTLTLQASGTTDSPITIYFDAGAKFSAPTFPTYLIDARNRSWITFDAAVRNAVHLECTNNGTPPMTQVQNTAIAATGGDHLTFQNLTITNIYKRSPSHTNDISDLGSGITLEGSDILIQNCTVSDMVEPITASYNATVSNLTVRGCNITRWNHGLKIPTANNNSYYLNITISSNRFDGYDVWELGDGSWGEGPHRNAIFMFNESPGTTGYVSNLVISCNYFGPGVNPQSESAGTAAIFLLVYSTNQNVDCLIYNNVFTLKAPADYSNGAITGIGRNFRIFNNTFAVGHGLSGQGTVGEPTVHTAILYNNLFFSTNGAVTPIVYGTGGNLVDINFNVYAAANNSHIFAYNGQSTWSQWTNYVQATLGKDWEKLSKTNLPMVDANFIPTSLDTVARGAGTNLSAYFTTDFYGNARPAGAWTIGAFEAAGQSPVSRITIGTIRSGGIR